VGAASAMNAPVFGCPVFVISLTAERCRWFEQQLSADEVRCVRATKRSEIRLDPVNGSATYVGSDDDSGGGGGGDSGGGGGARVRWLSPDVHPIFRLGPLEIAILISHLRAVSAGRQRLAQGSHGHFVVLEEDAELEPLQAAPLRTQRQLARLLRHLPRGWSVVQAAVIAELPWLRNLARRLAHSPARAVRRKGLYGMSWPFTPGRAVVANQSWVVPYWSAACYVVSRAGAQRLLARYWPAAPRTDADVTFELRSQRYAVADSVLFNLSNSWIMPPLLTQRVKGAHAEHAQYKQTAREFVLRTYLRGWGGEPLAQHARYNLTFDEWLVAPSREVRARRRSSPATRPQLRMMRTW